MVDHPVADRYMRGDLRVGDEVCKLDSEETATVLETLGYNLDQDRMYFVVDDGSVGFMKIRAGDDDWCCARVDFVVELIAARQLPNHIQ